ncbi:MAG: RelA/SpoT family protein [Bacteroidia bacterium]|nr:RelA/SpoT family protein [Bacteroidia bacterium]NNF30158.1 bifunctional (p)ppGpp synthetase/guanosine-3',5'-bis(diphosphate) 3'-pyrophosphohydrolase [Flavobacteriaceae bacterium]MBT8275036.1 RelA/SpoT family protein [Bacteroidia bacterium]NNJ81068.1 bifunctional (p)ppGpp synthetase/guanosine-3',5'-bis(diphosphate) 3'-pyrophosphohydrolase [Flavobacteriaceae bacterium]NNK55478.1 bifunctional (p)ppGpp synthetase/guanosine-3',5'-bis(diphosphate) 3'-pyrophosphohydrolase [Flavobacteriaceae bacteri
MTEEVLEAEKKELTRQYKELLKISYRTLTAADKRLIRSAFDVAVDAHKDQRRKSGEAYIFHPLAVAKIVASEIGLDATSIAAALLHDVVEDTEYTLADIEQLFGEAVARIVDGLTKISKMPYEKDVSMQAENFRKMLLTLHEDIRVIIIKIADRLHNMQTMDSMPEHKQVKIASETLYIYAPLAHRIGLYNIKTELEDLGLKYTEPNVYEDILSKIKESKEQQDAYIQDFSKVIKDSLDAEKLNYEIKGRPKSIFSIRRKMLAQNVSFDEVYDKFAVRIIYKSDHENEKFIAWKIYSIVTDHFRPNPTRLRDWISSPKSTGYEALHITVMGPQGRWVEVQIRSERMNEIAEKGYAAHYKYKNDEKEDIGLEDWLNKLQETLESAEVSAVDFVEDFKLNLYSKEIFVFSPKGDLYSLPKGGTALDFAFHIHTEVGLHTRGAKVNGKLVPLSHVLKSGDQVEIMTSEKANPTANWLNYATTGRARSKIKSSLKEEKKEIAAEGKVVLARKLKSLKITLDEKTINQLVVYFKLKTSLDLFYRVGAGIIDNKKLKDFAASRSNAFVSFFKNKIRKPGQPQDVDRDEITEKFDQLVFGKEEEKLDYKIANCCNPIPGDDVFGFLTVNEGIKVHKQNCPNALQLQSNYGYRIMLAKWIDSTQSDFRVELNISGIDTMGLVNEVTKIISNNLHINMKSVHFDSNDGVFNGKIIVVVKNKNILNNLVEKIKNINGIDKVKRA